MLNFKYIITFIFSSLRIVVGLATCNKVMGRLLVHVYRYVPLEGLSFTPELMSIGINIGQKVNVPYLCPLPLPSCFTQRPPNPVTESEGDCELPKVD